MPNNRSKRNPDREQLIHDAFARFESDIVIASVTTKSDEMSHKQFREARSRALQAAYSLATDRIFAAFRAPLPQPTEEHRGSRAEGSAEK